MLAAPYNAWVNAIRAWVDANPQHGGRYLGFSQSLRDGSRELTTKTGFGAPALQTPVLADGMGWVRLPCTATLSFPTDRYGDDEIMAALDSLLAAVLAMAQDGNSPVQVFLTNWRLTPGRALTGAIEFEFTVDIGER